MFSYYTAYVLVCPSCSKYLSNIAYFHYFLLHRDAEDNVHDSAATALFFFTCFYLLLLVMSLCFERSCRCDRRSHYLFFKLKFDIRAIYRLYGRQRPKAEHTEDSVFRQATFLRAAFKASFNLASSSGQSHKSHHFFSFSKRSSRPVLIALCSASLRTISSTLVPPTELPAKLAMLALARL